MLELASPPLNTCQFAPSSSVFETPRAVPMYKALLSPKVNERMSLGAVEINDQVMPPSDDLANPLAVMAKTRSGWRASETIGRTRLLLTTPAAALQVLPSLLRNRPWLVPAKYARSLIASAWTRVPSGGPLAE